jgi:hypothetical protein
MSRDLMERFVRWYQSRALVFLVFEAAVIGILALILMLGAVNDSVILYKEF